MKYPAIILALLCAPSFADIVQEARAPTGAAVLLYSEQGQCIAPARRAEYISPKGEVTPGCFKLLGLEAVQIAFLDGDAMQLPVEMFKAPSKS